MKDKQSLVERCESEIHSTFSRPHNRKQSLVYLVTQNKISIPSGSSKIPLFFYLLRARTK